MGPFTAQDPSGISKVELAFRALRDRPTGEVIAYSDLPYEGRVSQLKVRRLMEREQKRSIVTVRENGVCVGWKLVAGSEHVDVVERDRRRSLRWAGRALHSAETVDRRELSAGEQLRADAQLISATTAYHALRGIASRRLGVEDVRAWRARNGGSA